jgi:hypothetical protein
MSRIDTSYEFRAYFRPTLGRVALAVALAVFWHVLIVESSLTQAGLSSVSTVSGFWSTATRGALRYLQTDNVVLKFLTFFVLSYVFVWVGSLALRVLDSLQKLIIHKLRKTV